MAKNKFTTWNRLEGSPYKEDDVSPYEFRVRDPLWMLSRQWQMGNFEAEDNGSPITVYCDYTASKVMGVKGTDTSKFEQFELDEFPLESHIESVYDASYSLQDKYKAGVILIEIIEESALTSSQKSQLNKQLLGDASQYLIDGFTYIDDQEMDQYFALLLRKNQLDGVKLFLSGKTLRTAVGVAFNTSAIEEAWTKRLTTVIPSLANSLKYWKHDQLEYEFDIITSEGNRKFEQFNAKNYHNNSVEWYNFNHSKRIATSKIPSSSPEKISKQMIPSNFSFPGMPSASLWEMQDSKRNLMNLNPEKTELLKLVVTDFTLNFSNDWFDFPLTVENGTNVIIDKLRVKDVFGEQITINQSDSKTNFFSTGKNQKDALLLLTTNSKKEMGKPIEKVVFARDEIANLVFGVEQIVPTGFGLGKKGLEKKKGNEPEDLSIGSTKSNYKIKTTFEENWIPFVLKKEEQELLLHRASQFVHNPETETNERIRPQSILLRPGISDNNEQTTPYFIKEEEILRSGIVVQTNYQRTRWYDGRVVSWLAREKRLGKGEMSSNLRFDVLE